MSLALVSAGLIPAALALACNPQAYLTLDKAQYAPGDAVRVSGSFFKGDTNITVSIDRVALSATVKTTANGAFATTFALPANAPLGGYSVSAVGYEANGDVIAGLPARASFSVAAPAAAPQPAAGASAGGGGEAAVPAPVAAAQPSAAAARPARQPTASSSASGFREPGVINEPDVQSSSSQRGAQNNTAGSGGDRVSSGGRAVFGGSVAPAVSVPVGTTAATTVAAAPRARGATGTRVSAQVAERTATDDVWSALTPGRSPSVLPVAGDGVAVSSPRAGSQLALGVLLLGVGALALVGGLAAGEARRRRVGVRAKTR